MTHAVTLIPGDGTGPFVVDAARRVLEATGAGFDWDVQLAGAEALERDGNPLPDEVLSSIRATRVALKGPVASPLSASFPSTNMRLRQQLGLYACVRPCRLYPGVRSAYDAVDLVVIRENTEGMYTGIEFEQGAAETEELIGFVADGSGIALRDDSGVSVKTISVGATERIARFAFRYAETHRRTGVTAGHKANIMKFTDGLFLQTVRRVAAQEFPKLSVDDRIIDAMCMQLVQRPETFDVLLLPNLYGDIVSDIGAGLIGGLGVAPGAHFGDDIAVFEATHGTGPRIAEPARADPAALMLSGVMMLRYLGEADAARRLEGAVATVIVGGRSVTYDLKGSRDDPDAATADQMAEAVIRALDA